MNIIYKVIWNVALGIWIAVSEMAKGHLKSSHIIGFIALMSIFISNMSCANIIDLATPCNNGSSVVGTPIANDKGLQRAQNIGPVNGTGTYSTVTGCGATGGGSTGGSGVTIYGSSAVAVADFASVFGFNTQSATMGVAIGTNAWSLGSGSVALGFSADTSAAATNSIALGANSNTDAVNAIAIGSSANASVTDSIALGANSTTMAAIGGSFLTNKTTINGVVSVGSATITRRIQNVADGAADQDVATIAQLKVVNSKLTNVATALGGGSNYDTTTGVWTAPSYILTNPATGVATTYNDIGSAMSNLGLAVNQSLTFKDNRGGTSVNKLGSELAIVGDPNITTTVSSGQVVLGLNKDLKGLNSVETVSGTNKTMLTATGTTVTDGSNTSSYGAKGLNINSGAVVLDGTGLNVAGVVISKSGINANNQQISNVADGAIAAASKDAVNGGQLYAVNSTLQQAISQSGQNINNLAKNMTNALGGGSNYDTTTGVWTVPSYILTNPATGVATTYNDIGSAMSNLGLAVNQSLTFKDNRGGTSVNKLGSELAIVGDPNITTTVSSGQVVLGLNKDLKGLNSVETVSGTNKTMLTATGTTVTDGSNTSSYGAKGLNINSGAVVLDGTGLNVAGVVISKSGINANNQQISNVADGAIAAASKDAVNGGQLYVVNSTLQQAISQSGQNINNLAKNMTNALGGGSNYDTTTGVWTVPSYILTNPATGVATTYNDIGSAMNNLGLAVNQSLTFKDNRGGTSVNKLGSELAIVGDPNLTITVSNGQVSIGLNKNLVGLDSISMVNGGSQSTLNAQSLNVNGVVVSTDGININNKAIHNVAKATQASDAVNLGQVTSLIQNKAINTEQLTKTYELLANSLGGDAKYEQGVWRAPAYTLGYATSRTTVNDVGSAIKVLNQADEKLNSRIDHLSQRLEQVEKDTNTRISTLEKRVNAGIASALALESPAYVAGGLTYGVGASMYRGQSAVGISFRRTSETGHWSMNVGVSADSQGEPAFRIGVGGLIE